MNAGESAGALVDLYVRLRDEMDGGESSLDPNHKIRASIVMAIFGAVDAVGSDLAALEARARAKLGLAITSIAG
jgi:hypothetical protein